ncbi:MAG: NAD(P)-dependent oxidoreductase [bacterium]
MSTCVVLGAAGFVGSAVTEAARRRGHHVEAVTRSNYEDRIGTSCDLLINANGNSRKYVAARNPQDEFELSVNSVLRSIHDFPAKKYIHLSTIDVYPDHENPANNTEDAVIDPSKLSTYGFHKVLAEMIVQYYATSWLILRMAGSVGPGLKKNPIYDLFKGVPLRVNPDSLYQYMNTEDLAGIALDLAESGRDREIFNVVGDGLISIREIAALVPGSRLETAESAAPRERYEVSVVRLKALRPVPRTEETVQAFIRDVREGKVNIA